MNKIESYRLEIDEIDREITRLFKQRFEVVEKIGFEKKQCGIHPLSIKRWDQVCLNWRKAFTNTKVSKIFINGVLELIHNQALEIERNIK
jgi:chorismate mutase